IVQTNLFTPTETLVTPEVAEEGVVTVPLPEITVHAPAPTVGVFPANVAVVEHIDWSAPAFDVVGDASRVMVVVSLDAGQLPLMIVQTNEFAPADNAVTPDVGEPGDVTDALPAITVHTPVPTVGVLPASVAVVEHTVWSEPAFDVVGPWSLVMFT